MTTKATLTDMVRRSFIEMMKDVGVSIPGHILAFDPTTQLAQVQIGVIGVKARGGTFTPPPLIEVPVYFPGGQYFIEFEISPGDEGLITFSQRCIDAWKESGGVAENPILRFHDFSDAVFFPGVRSQVGKISSFQNNGIRLSNVDGTNFVWLKNDGTAEIKVTNLTVTGDMSCTQTITATTDVIGGGKSLSSHTHVGSATAPDGPISNTGVPA